MTEAVADGRLAPSARSICTAGLAATFGKTGQGLSYPSPKTAKAAQSADLQAAFKKHEGEAAPRREEAGPSHASGVF
jgi:hypothetical protein